MDHLFHSRNSWKRTTFFSCFSSKKDVKSDTCFHHERESLKKWLSHFPWFEPCADMTILMTQKWSIYRLYRPTWHPVFTCLSMAMLPRNDIWEISMPYYIPRGRSHAFPCHYASRCSTWFHGFRPMKSRFFVFFRNSFFSTFLQKMENRNFWIFSIFLKKTKIVIFRVVFLQGPNRLFPMVRP